MGHADITNNNTTSIQDWSSRQRYMVLMQEIRKMNKMHRTMLESKQEANAEVLAIIISKRKQELYLKMMRDKSIA